jgi:uncharacterized protein (TIGR03905 family)
MSNYTYSTHGVCSRKIEFEIEGDIVKNVSFVNGCSGNLQGIGKLVEGMNVEEVIKKLEGIDCNGRGTSCPDQLARALKEVKK